MYITINLEIENPSFKFINLHNSLSNLSLTKPAPYTLGNLSAPSLQYMGVIIYKWLKRS